MPAVSPFRALRYHLDTVGDFGRVLAPPYDVITPSQQARLHEASPYNVVRLILGQAMPTDTPQDNAYQRARGLFDLWRAQGVLRRDEQPSLTIVEQTFQADGSTARRLGVFALLGLDDASRGSVLRHEATLAGPKADRTRLLEAVPANLSPIFCVYPDEGAAIQSLCEQATRQAPPWATGRLETEQVRLWVLTDPEAIQQVQAGLAQRQVLIADGHHRFEVAAAHRNRYGAVMTYFVSMEDPGLRVRPIYRLLRQQPAELFEALRAMCAIQPARDLSGLLKWLGEPARGRFGCYTGGSFYRVAVSPERLSRWMSQPAVAKPLAGLDVSLLHGLLLPDLAVDSGKVSYTGNLEDALRAVDAREYAMTWLLRGIPVREVFALAAQGLTLPPKSTYFYPKALSGLAFNPFNES